MDENDEFKKLQDFPSSPDADGNINGNTMTQHGGFHVGLASNMDSFDPVQGGLHQSVFPYSLQEAYLTQNSQGSMSESVTSFEQSRAFPANSEPDEVLQERLRKKNSQAARRYRDKKKIEDAQKALEIEFLREENSRLRRGLEACNKEIFRLNWQLRSLEQQLGYNQAPPPGYNFQGYGQPFGQSQAPGFGCQIQGQGEGLGYNHAAAPPMLTGYGPQPAMFPHHPPSQVYQPPVSPPSPSDSGGGMKAGANEQQ